MRKGLIEVKAVSEAFVLERSAFSFWRTFVDEQTRFLVGNIQSFSLIFYWSALQITWLGEELWLLLICGLIWLILLNSILWKVRFFFLSFNLNLAHFLTKFRKAIDLLNFRFVFSRKFNIECIPLNQSWFFVCVFYCLWTRNFESLINLLSFYFEVISLFVFN